MIQRSKGTCSESHSHQAVQPGFEPNLEMLKICGGEGRGIGGRERGVGQADGKGKGEGDGIGREKALQEEGTVEEKTGEREEWRRQKRRAEQGKDVFLLLL